MQQKKMPIWDQRVFEFMEYCKKHQVKGIRDDNDFIAAIGIKTLATLNQVKLLRASFRLHHLQAIGTTFGVSMDYLLGFTNNMMRQDVKKSGLDLLREGLQLLENEKHIVNSTVNKRSKK